MTLARTLANVTASAAAKSIADNIPLSHFPARAPIEQWMSWTALVSPSGLGTPAPACPLAQLRHEHVFLSAGPCCYAIDDHGPGNAVLYFRAACDASLQGYASPFDTGSLGTSDAPGRLKPHAIRGVGTRVSFIQDGSVSIAEWRPMFARWLEHCYGKAPRKYLEARRSPKTDGEPQRTVPRSLLRNNGQYGREPCADRRAWTWELRARDRVGWEHIALLHVTFAKQERARTLASRAKLKGLGNPVRVLPLPKAPLRRPQTSPGAFYEHCGKALDEFVP